MVFYEKILNHVLLLRQTLDETEAIYCKNLVPVPTYLQISLEDGLESGSGS